MDELEAFLDHPGTLLDVRSPIEFTHATIPSAINLPLFSDAERALVGTTYKQEGKTSAIQLGLELVAPKMDEFIETALKSTNPRIFCWRGGMRSSSMALLFKGIGKKPLTLKGGYKAFRNWTLKKLKQKYHFFVIGGFTGTGKTDILHALHAEGEQILDLEALSHHRGSAFGHLGQLKQPSNEAFENAIAYQLHWMDPHKWIFVEDESRTIGQCKIPDPIYLQMRTSQLLFIETPKEQRIERLMALYGNYPAEVLINASKRLSKRLGHARVQEICHSLQTADFKTAADLLLDYYDNAYSYSLKRKGTLPICLKEMTLSPKKWAKKILSYIS